MDSEKYITLMALLSGPLMVAPLYGAFDQFGKDARPSGMGEAFVGVADDVSALYQFGPKNKYSFGFSAANVNRPDVSLEGSGDKAYRNNQMEICLERMRAVTTLAPRDKEILQAYQQLLQKQSTKLAAARP